MYASIRRYKTDSPAEVTRLVKEEFVSRISKIDGFLAYYVIDSGQGVATVSIFETRDGQEESNKVAAAWVQERLSGMLSPVEITAGQVVVHLVK